MKNLLAKLWRKTFREHWLFDSLVIAKQARRIHELSRTLHRTHYALLDVYDLLYSIGGPLNDNHDGFTKEQKKVFFEIRDAVDKGIIPHEECPAAADCPLCQEQK